MKRYLLVCLSAAFIFTAGLSCHSSQSNSSDSDSTDAVLTLKKQWETDTSLRAPESALWDASQQFFYISNINGKGNAHDGNGFISQMSANGKIIKLHWVDGLDAPKGLGMFGGQLYAADLDSLVIIDMQKAKIVKKIYIPGATFLNDIAVDKDGNVYMSDTRQGKVFCYADGKISIYLGGPEMKGANGLLWHNHLLWILTSDGIYNYDSTTQKLHLFSDNVKDGDGLASVDDSDFIASRWIGEVYYVKANGNAEKLLDTKTRHKNTADINFLPDSQLLVVPTFNGNTIVGYKLVQARK